jgi:hypothetical protein
MTIYEAMKNSIKNGGYDTSSFEHLVESIEKNIISIVDIPNIISNSYDIHTIAYDNSTRYDVDKISNKLFQFNGNSCESCFGLYTHDTIIDGVRFVTICDITYCDDMDIPFVSNSCVILSFKHDQLMQENIVKVSDNGPIVLTYDMELSNEDLIYIATRVPTSLKLCLMYTKQFNINMN